MPSDGYALFQPFPLIARLAAAVPGMTMGTSVMLLPMLNPLDVAEQVATLDAITGGRFILGAGLGYREAELRGAGVRRADLVGALRRVRRDSQAALERRAPARSVASTSRSTARRSAPTGPAAPARRC